VITKSKDSTAVRAGEELDLAALDRFLRERLSGQTAEFETANLEVEQFPGGHSNLTYLVRYGAQEFVLRRPPVGPVAPTAHDMPREFKLLSVIHPSFPLAPAPILLCDDASIIGVPFYLMERRSGRILRAGNSEIDHASRRQLSAAVIDTLADLHAVEIHSTGIAKIGKPAGFVARQVRGWTERWQRSKTGEVSEMDEVISWLNVRLPPDDGSDATIVHNDFKLDNLMLDRDHPARVVAVLDWEMCTVGDPLIDVGLALTYWTMLAGGSAGRSAGGSAGVSEGTSAEGSVGEGGDPNSSLRAITNGPGWFTREEFLSRYRAKTGRDLSRIVFYETFARFKVAVVIQQIYFRYTKGQTHDDRFRKFDQLVLELARDAIALAQQSGI
jgi:aminoglycoside phosphotransferase (APT) family kinase protein